MYLPPSYHYEEPYGNNIGGIQPFVIQSNPASFYDSWLTIGLDNGDPDHILQSVGIDYMQWTIKKAFVSKDAAVFMLNPRTQLIKNNHYLIAQLTLDNTKDHILQSVGIDFMQWTIKKAFVSKDAAVFMLNPRQQLIKNNHYLIAQLTLDNTKNHIFRVNAQGRLTKEDTVKENIWHGNKIIFNIPKKGTGSPSGH